MKIGILEAGSPPGALAGRFGSYGDMFRRLLGPAFRFQTFDVQAGALPAADDDCAAYIVSGSSSGVYDGDPWIGSLMDFIRRRIGSRPMAGICFGHQAMAQALGGQVEKSSKGWGVGQHQYDIATRTGWMDSAAPVALTVSHQDQVVSVGPEARVLGGNDFTPFGLVDYPSLRAVSIQAHPEFEPDFAAALIQMRRGDRFDQETADRAIASLKGPDDRRRVAVWMRRFLTAL